MNKQLFEDAIGEMPPSTVDVGAAIARGRRAELVHRVVNPVVATVGAVAVLLGAVSVVLLTGENRGDGIGTATPPSTTTSRSLDPCDRMSPTAPPPSEKPAVAADRLTDLVTAAVLRPGVILRTSPEATDPDGIQHGPLEFYHEFSAEKEEHPGGGCRPARDFYLAHADVESPTTGSISLYVGRSGGSPRDRAWQSCDESRGGVVGRTSCEEEAKPNGDKLLWSVIEPRRGDATYRVDLFRTDGTHVSVAAASTTASTVPLTRAQLTELALDPGMTLYPK